MRAKTIEFQPPKEFTIPEGTQPGEDFDAVCTFRMKDAGTICLVQLGDVKMPGYGDKDDSQKPSSAMQDYTKGMMAAGNQEAT